MGGNIKVALYDLGPLKASENKYVILGQQANENIYNLLKKQNDISVEKINTLAAETLKHYNVLILSTIHRLSDKDAGSADLGIQSVDYVRSLLNFVDSGGCVILGHDCVGFRHIWGNFQVFPMICTGQGLEESKKLVLSDKAHPLAAGLPETFEHSYTDHITIRPGEKTKIIFKDVNGAPAVVAGELSRGTVIGLGYSMGLYCKDKNHYTGELPEAEARLLLNAVRWAGVKEKYEVPQVNTDTSLLKQITTYNEQKKNESLSKYTNLPQPKFTEADMWLYPFWRIMLGNKKDTPVLDILENEQYLAQSVKNVKTMGFTGILTYAQSYTMYYPSKLYPQDIDPKMPKRFEILYNEAKKNGLKIKVIFCAWRRSADTWAKGVKNISKSDMDRLAKGEKEKDIFKDEYRRGGWVCPDHPDNQKMFINIIRETLEMYPDISEVHFDYVRYKDGYDTSCYCDYSLKQKAEFSKTHPGLSESEIAAEFSKQTLMNFFTECHNQVKKISPQIKTTTYTITPTAPKWVFGYPFDYHAKYVSRYLNADWPIENTENYTTQYVGWLKELNPKGVFQPMISSYDYKTGERLYLEFQILSHTFDKLSVKNKLVQFYDYAYLLKDTDGSLHDDMARGISKALGGTWK
ncbi:MAG TPA: hypothetical protein DC049_00725 [Spirochaetia bacterium]|nr:hypothetical protein [Spirochaetia bacterium]